MTDQTFSAFFSYVHDDDKHDTGRITRLRQLLEEEIRALSGEEFEIFQDYDDIHWGQKWAERLDSALDGSTLLISVVTPRYIRSEFCRKEMLQFVEREQQLNRNDLLFAIYYIDTDLSDANDSVVSAISNHQYFDWRDLRHEPHTNPEIGKRIEKMAREIIAALKRSSPPTARKIEANKENVESSSTPQAIEASAPGAMSSPAKRVEPPVVIVDPMPRRGDYTTISKAIESSEPGTRILIHPGLYREALIIEKPLEFIGEGQLDEIVIEAKDATTIEFRTEFGRIANLTIRQVGKSEDFAIIIRQGRLELEDCDISSQSLSCILIRDGADPRLRRNKIHDSRENGVFIYSNGRGTLEDNDIFNNELSGVEVRAGSDPVLRRNRIHHGKQDGVLIWENSKGIVEDNDIFQNTFSAVEIREGSDPIVRRNRIHDGEHVGIYIHTNATGTVEDNIIFTHVLSGIEIKAGADPKIQHNRIYDGEQCGVLVLENGRGLLEDNEIYNNALAGVSVQNSECTVRQNRIYQGKQGGVRVSGKSQCLVDGNEIYDNTFSGVIVIDGAKATIRNNQIHHNREHGLLFAEQSEGQLEHNTITDNTYSGVEIRQKANAVLHDNTISRNSYRGIWVHDDGHGVFENNDLRENSKGAFQIDDSSKPNIKEENNLQ